MTTTDIPLPEWSSTIPKTWKLDRLGKYAITIVSNVDKKSHDDESPILLCNYVDVYKNDCITSKVDFMEATATPHEIKKFALEEEDVAITKDSENPLDIAIPSLVSENLGGVLCGYHLAILHADKRNLFGPFLNWLHVSQTIRVYYEKHATGVTRWAIGRKHFKTCPVPLPPLPEQQRIAAFLDASCAAIDRAMETKKKQLEILEALRKSIIQKAVTRGLNPDVEMRDSGVDWLGKVPSVWTVKKLKRLLESPLSYGLNEAGIHEDPENPRYIRITDFNDNGRLREDTFRSLSREIASQALINEGDILLARSGATVGKSFLFTGYKGEACYADIS